MNLVVVSNRVARATANEPMTGGLAAALLPVVEKSGAIWVGSSDRIRDGPAEGSVRRNRGARRRRAGDGRSAGGALSRLLRGLRQFGAVAGAAFAARSDPRQRTRTISPIARSTPSWRGRCCGSASPRPAFWVQDYHFLTLAPELRELGVRHPIGFFLHTPLAGRTTSSPACRIIAS